MVRCIIVPGWQEVTKQAQNEGLADVFLDAGAIWSTSACGACLGGHMGIITKGESASPPRTATSAAAWATAKPRYPGRPAVAAASAVLGRVASPAALD